MGMGQSGEGAAMLRLSPQTRLIVVAAVFLIVASGAIWLAASQAWMGLALAPGDDGLVVVRDVQREDLPAVLQPGVRLDSLAAPGQGDPLDLRALDVIEEPDTLDTYAELNAFRARQSALDRVLSAGQVVLGVTLADGSSAEVELTALGSRPVWSLPFEFWLQLGVGGAGILLGGWVWALRHEEASTYFAISGFGLMLSATAAAIYSTRELALEGGLFRLLSAGNYTGTNIFGLALISLLLVYPHRLAGRRVIGAVWVLGLSVVLSHVLQLAPSQAVGAYAPMLAQFVALFALIVAQLHYSRRNPLARAALGWFGLSVLLGTGLFVFAIAAPTLLGLAPQASQANAFAIILLIYAGLAIGVARYRLFDLGTWAFRLISYLIGALLLLALDAVLIYGVALERLPAFGLALLTVGLVYLPLRNMIGSRILGRDRLDDQRFRQILDIALTRSSLEQAVGWHGLLSETFNPLTIETAASGTAAALHDAGQELLVPACGPLPALVLRFADGGRRLFSQADVNRVSGMIQLMQHALNSRDAHEQGARQERSRIARDLHDNIGAQLLRTLHSSEAERKDAIVSETLTDLRDIIANAHGNGIRLDEVLAELRYETNERLVQVGLALEWSVSGDEGRIVSARLAHTIRSIVREAASNAIRHAKATRLNVALLIADGRVSLSIADDGVGFDEKSTHAGDGLGNMRSRTLAHRGSFAISGAVGTSISVQLPLEDPAP